MKLLRVAFVKFSFTLSVMSDPLAVFVHRIPLLTTGEDARVLDSQSRICAWAFNQLKSLSDDLRAGYARLKAAKRVEPERRHAGLDETANEIGRVAFRRTFGNGPVANAVRPTSGMRMRQKTDWRGCSAPGAFICLAQAPSKDGVIGVSIPRDGGRRSIRPAPMQIKPGVPTLRDQRRKPLSTVQSVA